jgi:signal transduction protein with GAF and PtsI domain
LFNPTQPPAGTHDHGNQRLAELQVQVLQSVTDLGRQIFGAAACSLALLEPDEEHLRFSAASGEGAAAVIGVRLPVSRGIAGWVVSSGQLIAVDDVRRDPRFARDVAESTGYVPGSILAAPVETDSDTLGILEVLDRSLASDRDDMGLVTSLARVAAAWVVLTREIHAGDAFVRDAPAEIRSLATQLAQLAPTEQQAAGALLREFITYVNQRDG